MDFKQKAEEKKMSMSKNIARLAVTAGLTAALSFGGVMAPVTMAFADDAVTAPANSIIIEQAEGNATTTFKAYQIFKADVVDSTEAGATGKIVSNVEWADGVGADAQKAIIAAINEFQTNALKNDASAEDVANWLTENAKDTTVATRVDKDSVLNKIAKVVKDNVAPTGEPFNAGNAFEPKNADNTPNTGYYLFLTDDTNIGQSTKNNKKNTGTSPIFAVVGDSGVKVAEKTKIPTVEKKIMDDKPGSKWEDKADSQMGQDVHYQLKGTVADNIATFDTYYYEFHDELSAGLIADKDSVKVTVYANDDDATGTEVNLPNGAVNYNTTENNNLLTVKFDNLKAVTARGGSSAIDITKDSKVVVTYTAKLNPEKAEKVTVGGMGNANEVKLIYSNNPMSEGKGESVPDTVRDYTYALKLVKEDSADNTKLKDVMFTIKATGADELAPDTVGTQFVQEDGSLGDAEHKFKTNEKGEISVTGLDAGTYTVHEVEGSNPGYNTLDDFTFTITAKGLDELEGATLAGNTDPNTLKVTAEKEGSTLVTPSVNGGTVTLTVQNKKGTGLPLTGLNGVTFTWIAGGAVLCIGVAHLIRSRKQAEESEQE